MKLVYAIGLSLFLCTSAYAQKTDKAAVEHFTNTYKKKNYKRFEGKISVKDQLVAFDDKVIFYEKSDQLTLQILKEGLIYPQLLTDYQMQKFLDETTDKTQKRFLKLQKDPKAGFDMNNIKITKLNEIISPESAPKVRRYSIWIKDNRNPVSYRYFIELTNKNADNTTSVSDFIKNAKVTHLYQKTE